MRSYECTIIFTPQLDESAFRATADKYAGLVTAQGGVLTKREQWGKRRLAYSIRHNSEGYYFLLGFRGERSLLAELDRQLRLDESVLRHLIVKDELARGDEPALGGRERQEQKAGKEEV